MIKGFDLKKFLEGMFVGLSLGQALILRFLLGGFSLFLGGYILLDKFPFRQLFSSLTTPPKLLVFFFCFWVALWTMTIYLGIEILISSWEIFQEEKKKGNIHTLNLRDFRS